MIAGGAFSFVPLAGEWLWERVFDSLSKKPLVGAVLGVSDV